MRAPTNNTHVARAAKAVRDANRRARRLAAAEPQVQAPPPMRSAPTSADDIILSAFFLEAEMDECISLLDRLNDSLVSLAKTRAWERLVAEDEWIDLSAEEVRRLSDA